jgi:hypothetical protein
MIRLLQLEPAKSLRDPIKCTLHEVLLDANPIYEAISYSWDGQASISEVLCSGKPLLVTPNAALVLRYLRMPKLARWVWIDSICINQNDMQEKTIQVRMMGEIYSKASEVLLWIGEMTKTLELIFKMMSGREELDRQQTFQAQDGFTSNPVESDDAIDFIQRYITRPLWHIAVILGGRFACKSRLSVLILFQRPIPSFQVTTSMARSLPIPFSKEYGACKK